MSDILANKTDAEIEEIYNSATMEDLQSMLIQEKCLNRRRILRKVMRNKSCNPPDKLQVYKPDIDEEKKNVDKMKSIQTKIIESSNNSVPFKNKDDILKKLNEMRKQLHDVVDLSERKELRQEIQKLENLCCTQENAINYGTINHLSTQLNQDKKKEIEDIQIPPKNLPAEIKDKNVIDSKPKFNFIKTPEKDNHFPNVKKSEMKISQIKPSYNNNNSSDPLKSQNNQINDQNSKIKFSNKNDLDEIEHSELIKKNFISSQENNNSVHSESLKNNSLNHLQKSEIKTTDIDLKTKVRPFPNELIASKPIPLNITPDSPTTQTKSNVSRVSSVRDQFEKPQTSSNSNKSKDSYKMSDKERNDLINALSKPDENIPKGAFVGHNLTVKDVHPGKNSQQMNSVDKLHSKSTKFKLKDLLLIWIEKNTQEYQNVKISNYSKSWADGLAFCALIHHFYPESFDYNILSSNDHLKNFTLAFDTAKKYAGIEPLIDPEDMIILESPDEKSVYTYVQFMYNTLKNHPKNSVKRAEKP